MHKSHFGIIGLGVMGRSLAKNIAGNSYSLSVYNRITPSEKEVIPTFMKEVISKSVHGFTDLSSFVDSLASPRRILLMVNAGTAVDHVLESLIPLLAPGDIIIDGGNSHYQDTQRRVSFLQENQLHFIGAGVSGGEEGALKGPSMMIGGDSEAYRHVQPIFESMAAKDVKGNPCVSLIGPDGSGHFVKTVHNGIEYAEMQLLAECYALLVPSYSYPEIAAIFKEWNKGTLQSYLLEITADILIKKEGNDYLLDKVLDKAGSKGTGSWTSQTAFQLGVPTPTINAAVLARYMSSFHKERSTWSSKVSKDMKSEDTINLEDLKATYTFARIINHHQGFQLIKEAAKENNWEIDLSELARIWTAGCIIKSKFMESLVQTFKNSESILEDFDHFNSLVSSEKSIVSILKYALSNRTSIASISNSYDYFISLTTARSSAHIIQAQRDEFGAHTYKRIDRPIDQSFTTKWTSNG